MTTASEAYEAVKKRLQGDAGRILWIINDHNAHKKDKITPFWAIARMLFPIAEALGDLHFHDSCGSPLPRIIKDKLNKQNPVYGQLPHTITQLFRHSLMHTDEMRVLRTSSGTMGWQLTLNGESKHLALDPHDDGTIILTFDLTQFYNDLLWLCDQLKESDQSQDQNVVKKYNSWRIKDITSGKRRSDSETESAREIDDLFKSKSTSYS